MRVNLSDEMILSLNELAQYYKNQHGEIEILPTNQNAINFIVELSEPVIESPGRFVAALREMEEYNDA